MMMNRTSFLVAPLVLVLAACSAAPAARPSPTAEPAAPEARDDPTPTAPPSPTPSPAATALPSPTPCRQGGRLEEGLVEDDGFGRDLAYLVYLPPCQPPGSASLPVLYLLHGLAGTPQQWLDLGLVATADRLIQRGEIPPVLIVMPWQRTGLESEPAIVEGLLPQVERTYPAAADSELRALGGISRGAGWAFRIGFRQWGKFGSVGLHSPALLAGDSFAVERWLPGSGRQEQPRLWIDIGRRDTLLEPAQELAGRLDELGLAYEFHLNQGWHDEDYWSAHLGEYLRWYAAGW